MDRNGQQMCPYYEARCMHLHIWKVASPHMHATMNKRGSEDHVQQSTLLLAKRHASSLPSGQCAQMDPPQVTRAYRQRHCLARQSRLYFVKPACSSAHQL
eukprot:876477-Pelagomonas_calceolata.AAC.5